MWQFSSQIWGEGVTVYLSHTQLVTLTVILQIVAVEVDVEGVAASAVVAVVADAVVLTEVEGGEGSEVVEVEGSVGGEEDTDTVWGWKAVCVCAWESVCVRERGCSFTLGIVLWHCTSEDMVVMD